MELINLFAFILPIIIFAYWITVGYATLSLLKPQISIVQNCLLAPAIGIGITLLPIFWLNHAGIPVGQFAVPLTLFLLIFSLIILIKQKPNFPIKQYRPFFLIFLLALWLTGRPLLEYGFDWVSYCNDDMTNYCLSAQRFLRYGYNQIPNAEKITADYSLNYWFMPFNLIRPGSDLILAWVSGTLKIAPLKIFMVTILALHLALISVTGALVIQAKRFFYIGIWVCLLLAVSAMISLGTLSQLIAQLCGLVLLISALLLLVNINALQKLNLRHNILYSIVIAILLLVYPELLPFLILSFILYFSIAIGSRRWALSKIFFINILIIFLLITIELNAYLADVSIFLLYQAQRGKIYSNGIEDVLFPYYLLPSGLANIWGLHPLNEYFNNHKLNISIIIGSALSIFTALFAIYQLAHKRYLVIANSLIIMVGCLLLLFFKNIDFGLYKLAMYIQPLMLSMFVIACFEIAPTKTLKIIPIICLIAVNLHTQNYYITKSRDFDEKLGGGLTEVRYASATKLNEEFKQLISLYPNNHLIISDTQNIVIAKFQALNIQDRNLIFLANDYFRNITFKADYTFNKTLIAAAQKILTEIHQSFDTLNFLFIKENQLLTNNFFKIKKISPQELEGAVLITNTDRQSIFNINKTHTNTKQNYLIFPMKSIQNHLVFVCSKYGTHNFLSNPYETAIYPSENDLFFPKNKMSSIGRYLLFLILNPTTHPKLLVHLTATLNHDGKNELPTKAILIGKKEVALPFMGRGSGRVFSSSFEPKILNSNPYLMLDFKKDIIHLPQVKKGLLSLYGKNINIDRRMIIGFAREISLYSEDEYQQIKAPSNISHFPDDLANRNLEYSGIYEDGWVSEDSFYVLQPPHEKSHLIIKGIFPEIDGQNKQTQVTILVDGKIIHQQLISPGEFVINKNIQQPLLKHKIELHFTRIQRLPNSDTRPIAAKIYFLGFA